MEKTELKKLIESATEERLREIVNDWIDNSDEFRKYVEHELNPPLDEIDFDTELARAMMYELNQSMVRHGPEILDWRNIYYYHIEPWAKTADKMKTYSLWNLVVAIIDRVMMTVSDEDFSGDDWYATDYSDDIDNIIQTLGNLFGLLIIREDLTDVDLVNLEGIVDEARNEDKIYNYLSTPYETMLELIHVRKEAKEISGGLYDIMIEANFDRKAGKWISRKIDFLRSKGMMEEAEFEMSQNLRYPEVALKCYRELVAAEKWDEAIALLDKAIELRKEESDRWFEFNLLPDWLAMKQQLLTEHGSKDAQIKNLTELFHQSLGGKREEYYESLRKIIPDDEWKEFYTKLLSSEAEYLILERIAPFLIAEHENEWLYRLLRENEEKDKTDYRTPLKYSASIMADYNKEMRAMMVRTFRNYADDRFGFRRKVKTGKYFYFCEDLSKLSDIGMNEELSELVTYFKENFKTRSSLLAELRKIKL